MNPFGLWSRFYRRMAVEYCRYKCGVNIFI